MALSNYILQSVVCSFVFTGYGFALYGRLERYQLYYVVAACWAVSLAESPLWLRHYRFGPLEWCWRSLTYWEEASDADPPPVPRAHRRGIRRLNPSECAALHPAPDML
jgi:uncharacterized membrane protein YeiB